MNRIKKNIVVRFFSIQSKDSFLNAFVTTYSANENSARIFNIRSKKHLIKISKEINLSRVTAYPLTLVRERNTWQTKASSNGKIVGVSSNQGIIGDPYYFLAVPKKKMLLGFTSGPSGSLKSVGKTMLEQFSVDRKENISLELIPKEKEFSTLQQIEEYSNLHFKINSSSLSEISDNAPDLIKNLSSAPYIQNDMQLILDIDYSNSTNKSLTKDSVVEIVNFLSDHDGCSVLKVKGNDEEGELINLDFINAFINYKTDIITRSKFIDEKTSLKLLREALMYYMKN